ncbi:uncharacterized protein LOC117235042 isoform X2 [Bombus vosnesenskii]|uniref:Uncharacterized protein LOC117235042 isoform X2 n=1 Tax=Bombus vosnesenskii TaxID=207650 RepID=A0A6J3KHD2_9HYME|nr:uncharacterized protein LOC117235042 isoform X2 [Bombus vosnesenskii]
MPWRAARERPAPWIERNHGTRKGDRGLTGFNTILDAAQPSPANYLKALLQNRITSPKTGGVVARTENRWNLVFCPDNGII